MAVFKCKMCGGALEIREDITVAECEYCGTTQTVPTADNEKKISLFTRANKLRAACEFDKAAGVYESIVAEFIEEAEAYWGLILCNYGIEYVDDPKTGKKIPTCHRSSFDSVLDSENFEMVMENADAVSRKVYREEAKTIEELRKSIIEVSSKEEPYDIFICYKETDENGDRTIDSVIAQDVYTELTDKGYRVFFSRITLEDKLGQEYEPYIFAALNSAKVMLSFGTDYEYYNAVWVKNEWSRFLQLIAKGEKKTLIPCYKNIDAYDMPKEFARLQAQDMGKVGAVQDLLRGIEKIVPKNVPSQVAEKVTVTQSGGPNVEALLKRGNNALEDGSFSEAKTHFDKVLDIDAECAEAYLGLAMAEEGVCKIASYAYSEKLENKNYLRAKKFADENLCGQLEYYEKEAEEYRLREEVRIKKEQDEEILRIKIETEERVNRLRPLMIRAKTAGCLIKATEERSLAIKSNGTVLSTDRFDKSKLHYVKGWADIVTISAASWYDIAGLRSNGTVVLEERITENKDVRGWKDIVDIVITPYYIFGLRSDGTVLANGSYKVEKHAASTWKDIVAISSHSQHVVGLKSDGTVVATGYNTFHQCDVSDWDNIVKVFTGENSTVGLRSDGTVVATGLYGGSVSDWRNIVDVSIGKTLNGYNYTIGLRSDGTVVASTDAYYHCDVLDWTEIVAIATTKNFTIGLRSDGTIVGVGIDEIGIGFINPNWTDIIAFSAGDNHILGLKSDGTVVATGLDSRNECKVSGWKLFDNFDDLEDRKGKIAEHKAEYRSKNLCQHCGGTFKGMFKKVCTNCGEEKDYK